MGENGLVELAIPNTCNLSNEELKKSILFKVNMVLNLSIPEFYNVKQVKNLLREEFKRNFYCRVTEGHK